jgi:glutamate N-acetyltransferase/amino-acid N-acetyltransferase
VTVRGAQARGEAKLAANAVMTSPLVKTMLFGAEPNWGRLMAAVGRSGATVLEGRVDIWIAGHQVVHSGVAASTDLSAAAAAMRGSEFDIVIDLHLGDASFTGWTCDLNGEYVKINAGYMT